MTDNEVIKALECCNKPIRENSYTECAFYHSGKCSSNMLNATLDLINRQKAEIEELKDILEKVPTNAYDLQVEASEKLENQIKSEAIKEFAERLKRKRIALTCEEPVYDLFKVGAIDNLVKEMEEENENDRA